MAGSNVCAWINAGTSKENIAMTDDFLDEFLMESDT